MRKRSLSFIFLFVALYVEGVQMDSIFINAPFDILPHINRTARMDLLNTIQSGEDNVVKNAFGDSCRMEVYSKNYLKLKLSKVFTLEIKLIGKKGKKNYILLNETCCASTCDSRLSVYDSTWQEVDMPHITARPDFSSFLKNKRDAKKLSNYFAPLFIRAVLSPENEEISFILDSESVLDKEQQKEWKWKLNPIYKRPIVVKVK